MARKSKKLKAAYEAFDRNKTYPLTEAVALVKGNASSKFDETIEIAKEVQVRTLGSRSPILTTKG